MARIAYLINTSSTNATYRSLYYEQTADIDLSAHYWDAIGFSNTYNFSGFYDGGDHTISGLFTQTGTGTTYNYQGLFGYVRGTSSSNPAVIQNISINYDSIVQGYQYVGGVVGCAYTATTTNCNNAGIVKGYRYIGGVVGAVYSSTVVTNCYNTGTVSGSDDYVGGVVGLISSSTITNCYNIGTVSGDFRVGGVVGHGQYGTITKCYNIGAVNGSGYNVGGIIGLAASSLTITNCYNTGTVNGSENNVGGIVGSASSSITNCYNIGTIIGGPRVGGVVGYANSSVTITNCYNTGSVSGSEAVGGVVGIVYSSTTYNCYYGGNCTLSYGIGSSSSNTGASKDSNLVTNAKSISWYQNSSNWNSSYPWDFTNIWGFVVGKNGGYPILIDAQYTLIEYHSNYGTETIIYDYHMGDDPIEIYGDIFTRDGYMFVNWNTSADGTGTSYEAGQSYTGLLNLTLYAQWRLPIIQITLDWTGIVGGSPNTIYLWYSDSYYSDESCTNAISRLSYPTNNGYTFRGFFSGMNGTGTQFVDSSGNFLTYTTMTTTWHAYFVANNPAYYDSEGGYWYIENGYMPQTRVTNTTTWNYLNNNWSSLSNGNTYSMGATGNLQSKVYSGNEYCTYNGEYYLVEPIRWRLDYSSSQRSGYGTTTDTLAIMDTIVYVGRYSTGAINAGSGYSSVTVDYLDNNRISNTYLVSWTQSMPTFGTTSLNGTPTSVTARIFVSSIDEIERVAGSGAVKFSDLVSDFLKRTGNDLLYYTRNLGTNYNNIICLNENGDRTQRKPNLTVNQLGVQFTIKVTEYACV